MIDLIERLRDTSFEPTCQLPTPKLCIEAADEIERFTNLLEYANNEIKDGRKEIERLENALRGIAGYKDGDLSSIDADDMADMAAKALNRAAI